MRYLIILFLLINSFLEAKELEKVSIQLKWKNSFQFAGYYAALEKGFYEEEGLDVTINEKVFKSKSYVKSVLDGDSQYGISDSAIINHAKKHPDLVWLAQIFQHSPLVLLTLKESNIVSPYELINRNIPASTLSKLSAPIYAMILNTIPDPKQNVNFIDKAFFDYDKLVNKELDALPAYITDQPYLFKEKGVDVNIINPQNYGIDFYGDNLFTTKEEVEKHPKRVEKIIRATLRGWEYALDHQEEIVDLILKKYNTQNRSRKHLLYEAKMTDRMIMKELIPLGQIDKFKVENILRIYYEVGVLKTPDMPEGLIYNKRDDSRVLLTKEENDWLAKQDKLSFAAPFGIKPIISLNEIYEVEGYIPDLLKIISDAVGKDIKTTPFMEDKNNKYHMYIKDDKFHAIPNVAINEKTKKLYLFTKPYLRTHYNFFTNKKYINQIKSVEDLKDKIVAVSKNHHSLIQFLQGKVKRVVEVKDTKRQLELLEYEKVDVVAGYATYHRFIQQSMFSNIYFAFSSKKALDIRIGVNPKYPMLVSILNKGIDKISLEQRSQISKKWVIDPTLDKLKMFLPKEVQYINNLKEINMCISPKWMPYEKIDKNGNHVGLISEYMKIFEEKTSLNFKLIETKNYSESLKYLKDGKCQIISADVATRKNKELFFTTKSYFTSPRVFAVRSNEPLVKDFNELVEKGRVIAVVKNSPAITMLPKIYPNVKIHKVENSKQGLQKVVNQEVDAFVNILGSISYEIQKENILGVKIGGVVPFDVKLSVLINKNYPELINIFNKVVDQISESDKATIYNKWLSIKFEKGVDYKLIWQISALFGIILIFIVYRNILTQKSNRRLKSQQREIESKNEELKRQFIELKNTQAKLKEKEKMALLGEMLGNIAHQWRQPLSIMTSVASGMRLNKEYGLLEDKDLDNGIETIMKTSMYLSNTIDDFRSLANQNFIAKKFNLNEVIDESLVIVKPALIENKIDIVKDIDRTIELYSYDNFLTQIILNMVLNCKDAFEDKDIKRRYIFISAKRVENKIKFTIKDNAGGISEDIIGKIFEPYFTTKHRAQGTGLGLHMVYNIVNGSLKGSIEVKNEVFEYEKQQYKGASFIMLLQNIK